VPERAIIALVLGILRKDIAIGMFFREGEFKNEITTTKQLKAI
jgi:hypothetical protein